MGDIDHRTAHGRNLLPYESHVLTTLSDLESSTVLPLGRKKGDIASLPQNMSSVIPMCKQLDNTAWIM